MAYDVELHKYFVIRVSGKTPESEENKKEKVNMFLMILAIFFLSKHIHKTTYIIQISNYDGFMTCEGFNSLSDL